MEYIYNEFNDKDKFKKVLNLYQDIIYRNNNKSKDILLLVENNILKLKYEKSLNLNLSEDINIITYSNFVKRELVKFWPILIEKCDRLESKFLSPRFISSSLTDYIIREKVIQKRELEGYFDDITGTNKSIAMSINTNINKASLALIDFTTIGEKIYFSKKNRDSIMKFSYSQMNEIINYYIDILLQGGTIDNSLSIYLYNNYLLLDKEYQKYLKEEINYVIVDSLESCSVAEVDFIDTIKQYTKDSYIFFNRTRDYSVFNNIDMDYINEKIIKPYLDYIKNNDLIIDNIENKENLLTHIRGDISIEDICILNNKIYLSEFSQLYNEMISEVCNKIYELVNLGYKQKDIAIISPINNVVLDFQVTNKLKNRNIQVFNTKKDKRVVDYPYANALVVVASIFYDYDKYITEEEYINAIEVLLDVNKIKAFKIYKDKDDKDILNLIEYIKNKRNENLKISEFLIKFYIDKMLNLKYGKENVIICKQIIYESEIFTENIKILGLDNKKEKEKIFIEALKTTINDYYTSLEYDDLIDSDKIILTTPYSYISHNLQRPIQIWLDIGSNAWNMKIEKDISNIIVLRKSFKEGKIYTDTMEEEYKKYYLYNMIYNLLINTQEVYAYKSEYTVNGYMQESILYSLLLKILDKRNNSNE